MLVSNRSCTAPHSRQWLPASMLTFWHGPRWLHHSPENWQITCFPFVHKAKGIRDWLCWKVFPCWCVWQCLTWYSLPWLCHFLQTIPVPWWASAIASQCFMRSATPSWTFWLTSATSSTCCSKYGVSPSTWRTRRPSSTSLATDTKTWVLSHRFICLTLAETFFSGTVVWCF